MYCPKCNQARTPEQVTCNHCGIVFHKYEDYLRQKALLSNPSDSAEESASRSDLRELSRQLLVPPQSMHRYFGGYAFLWLAFVVWGFSYILLDMAALGTNSQFLHKVNLPFHEAGHVIFGIFGQFIGSLGGTLGQLLMPMIAGIALLRSSGDTFGASLCLWWFGENFLDIAPYMADARAGEMLLLGGNHGKSSPYGFHDWEYILGETGLLAHDPLLASITLNAGRGIMLLAMLWGGYLLLRCRKEKSKRSLRWD